MASKLSNWDGILIIDWFVCLSDNTSGSQRGAICEYPPLGAEGGREVELPGQFSVFATYVFTIHCFLRWDADEVLISSFNAGVCRYVSDCCGSEGSKGVIEDERRQNWLHVEEKSLGIYLK